MTLPDALFPPDFAARIDALMRDPRGSFCPRAVLLGEVDAAERSVATLVGIDPQGALRLLSAQPLRDGVRYTVEAPDGQAPLPAAAYLLDSLRPGSRPGDASALWVCTLVPAA
ncbi:hypothetical protein [Thiomonas sp.]|uniref:hypothetical protein n=1 Tax=Thiomonas sp. TaxID=2047785 RepID=UPI002638ADBF|nr:hypothetical protein [Thiomonas sp.]